MKNSTMKLEKFEYANGTLALNIETPTLFSCLISTFLSTFDKI